MRCDEAVEAVASLAADQQASDAVQAEHVATCLRCQARVSRDRRLVRDLRSLRSEVVSPDVTLLSSVLCAIDAEAASIDRIRTRRRVYMGSAATAAGGLVVALAARRLQSVGG